MNKNQTLVNMQSYLDKIEMSLSEGAFQEVKTLSDIYYKTFISNLNDVWASEEMKNQKEKIKSIASTIEEVRIPDLLNGGHYKKIHSLNVALEKLQHCLSSLYNKEEFEIKMIAEKYKNCLPELFITSDNVGEDKPVYYSEEAMNSLENSIKYNYLVTHFNEQHRGIGKTSAIIQKAHEEGYAIVCGNGNQVQYIQERAKEMGISSVEAYSQYSDVKGLKYMDFLVDELVSKESLTKFTSCGHRIMGGFYRIVV